MPGERSDNESTQTITSSTIGRRHLFATAAVGVGAAALNTPAHALAKESTEDAHAFTVRQPEYQDDREWIHLTLDPDGRNAPVPLTIKGTGKAESTISVSSTTGLVTVGDKSESANERAAEMAAAGDTTTVWVTPQRVGEPGKSADTIVIESVGVRRGIDVWVEPEEGVWAAPYGENGPMELGIVAVHASLMRKGEDSEVIMISPPRARDNDGNPKTNPRFPDQYEWDKFKLEDVEMKALELPSFAVVDRKMESNVKNLFCGGQAQMPDGRLLHAGGHMNRDAGYKKDDSKNHNSNMIYYYDPKKDDKAEAWVPRVHNMKYRRWYPTVTALPDGRMLICSGSDRLPLWSPKDAKADGFFEQINNNYIIIDPNKSTMVEPRELISKTKIDAINQKIRDANRETLTDREIEELLQQLATYPGVYVLPIHQSENKAVIAVVESNRGWLYTYKDRENLVRKNKDGEQEQAMYPMITKGSRSYPHYGSQVLLPLEDGTEKKLRIRILAVGGQHESEGVHRRGTIRKADHPTTDTAEIFEIDTQHVTGKWSRVGRMHSKRILSDATLLADGQVLVTGGAGWGMGDYNGDPVFEAELFDPADSKSVFKRAATAKTERRYHSTALLLPDGCMMKAGSTGGFGGYTDDTEDRMQVQTTCELYYPGYFFRGPRPIIDSVKNEAGENDPFQYGEQIEVTVTGAAMNSEARLALIRPGATTHSNNMNQRFVWLKSTVTENTVDRTWTVNSTIPKSAGMVPPGDCLVVVVASNKVPSEAKWATIGGAPKVNPIG